MQLRQRQTVRWNHNHISKWKNHYVKELVFTIESPSEMIKILEFYNEIEQGNKIEFPIKNFTTGHDKRGVE